MKVFSIGHLLIILSNGFLLMSNFVILFDGLKVNFDNSVDRYIALFLGFGVFFSWISVFNVLNDIKNFDIVSFQLFLINFFPQTNLSHFLNNFLTFC
jgi:hypothetical protein